MARLRIRCSDGDRPTVQRRAEAVLRTMHWRPRALPASAILCIRRFPDPKPGTLRLDHQWSGDSTSWQRAAGEALDRFADKAARPLNGPVPANAEAVVFLDPAEMLACLARDWTDGSVGLRWWWRSLLRTTDPGRALLETWLEAIEHAPAALQRLAEQGNAVSFVRALSAIQARTLLENVAHKFGLAALLAALESECCDGSPNGKRETVPTADSAARETNGAAVQSRPTLRPPWQAWVTGFENEDLTMERLVLLVVSLMLYRAPGVVRQSSFATQLVRWERERTISHKDKAFAALMRPPVADDRAEKPSPTTRQNDELSTVSTAPSVESRSAASPPTPPSQLSIALTRPAAVSRPSIADPPTVPLARPPAIHASQYVTSIPPPTETNGSPAIVFDKADEPLRPPTVPSIPHTRSNEQCAAPAIPFRELVETEFGGLFYLINLGLFLKLYGDFTSPLRPGLALPVWDFIALVGDNIVGERLRADPLWDLLARLSGREAETEPGDGFAAPRDWEVPEDWTDFRQSAAAVIGLGASSEAESGLAEWFGWLMPYLRWRLLRALGLDDPAKLSPVLCEQSARIRVTETHLDVRFTLARLPIQVRLAGLDRNPGWVPAAGRFIAFHYD